jgi:hypothetical protein
MGPSALRSTACSQAVGRRVCGLRASG